jgi:hypothetical protein
MSKLLILTDRHPRDRDWKGAFAWDLIRGLAESQHQVLVLTTTDPKTIEVAHPRLTIARPAPSWRADNLPRFLQAILSFQPDVIHTFHPGQTKRFSALTIWPYLHSACFVLPRMRRFSTFFENQDLLAKDPALSWHQGSERGNAITAAQARRLNERLKIPVDVLPLEMELPRTLEDDEDSSWVDSKYILVPAPVSAWTHPQVDLNSLRQFLLNHPEWSARIVGGWGDLPLSERRTGWQELMTVADRVSLLDGIDIVEFSRQLREAQAVWLETLDPDRWAFVLAAHMAETVGKTIYGAKPMLESGSPANFLSRLYSYS